MDLLKGFKEKNEQKKAKAFYVDLPKLKADPRELRKVKALMGARLTAFIDTTFIEGAKKTEELQNSGKNVSELKMLSSPFKNVKTIGGVVCVYLPPKYTNNFFELGARYQMARLTANQVVELADKLSDEITGSLDLFPALRVLNFLRSENLDEDGAETEEPP
jgi:hypothetical protein